MAENNQRKIANPIDFDDDDPFAELTRIMGFDPRVSALAKDKASPATGVRAASPAVVAQFAPTAAPAAPAARAPEPAAVADIADDDFGIDLEKELLGDLADFEVSRAAPAPSPHAIEPEPYEPQPHEAAAALPEIEPVSQKVEPPPVAVAPAPAVSRAAAEPQMPAPAAVPAPAASAPAAAEPAHASTSALAGATAEFGIEDEFENAFAAALLDDPLPRAEPPQEASDRERPVEAAAWDHAAEPADDLLPGFDFEDFDLDDPQAEETPAEPASRAEAPVAQAVTPPAAGPARSPAEDDFFAEVDMDFSAAFDRDLAGETDGGEHHSPIANHAAEPEQRPSGGRMQPDAFDMDFEQELSAILDEPRTHPQASGREAVQPAAQGPVVQPLPAGPAWRPETRPAAQFLSDPRWAGLEDDKEDQPVASGSQSTASPSAADRTENPAGPRRLFADPSLVARHASYRAAATQAAQPAAQPSPPAVEDLDDLLDAMETEVHPEHVPAGQGHVAAGSWAEAYARQATPAYRPVAFQEDAAPVPASHADDRSAGYRSAPEIETIDVPEAAVAVADDLDIPELDYQEDERQAPAYDDLDADFAAAFSNPTAGEEPASQATRGFAAAAERSGFDMFDQPAHAGVSQPVPAFHSHYQSAAADDYYDDPAAGHEDAAAQPHTMQGRYADLDFDGDAGEEALPAMATKPPIEARPRRGRMAAAAVAGVVVLGGVGALAFSFGGKAPESPVLVKADDGPVKVKPKDPGGTVVPNQDNKVYDAVKGGTATATAQPMQEKLVTTSEEPVDMAAVERKDALPGVGADDTIVPKGEDRIDPAASADDTPASDGVLVTPRRVKTMIVRADGTLVPSDDPKADKAADVATTSTTVAEAAPLQPADPATAPTADDETGAVATQDAAPAKTGADGDSVPVKSVKTRTVVAADEAVPAAPALAPANIGDEAAADSKPAAAAKVEAEKVASANVDPVVIAAGTWSVQIASQPSEESAKSTYQDLSRRYAGVIGGRGVAIVKADIAGKGTYWRVRVPAKSRDDAIGLCNDYKAAGGNCFVSK